MRKAINKKSISTDNSRIDIDEIHKKSIIMLRDVKHVLDKYNLIYWLDHGTLLGAMRDKKLIPWDDEIDLGTYADKFPKIKDFCMEINKKGYFSEYAHDRIKIRNKDWKTGYFIIDLHLYRSVNEYYVCDYHEGKKSIFDIFFRNLERLERLFSCYDYRDKVKYYRFKLISQVLMSNNINPKAWKNIQFIKGPLNRPESFTLKGPKFRIVSDPIKNVISSSFVYSILDKLFNILPKSFIGAFHNSLTNLYKLKGYNYSKLKAKKDYFENFTTIIFYGIRIKIPKKSKDYLRDIYGARWKVPNSAWQRKDMGIISK